MICRHRWNVRELVKKVSGHTHPVKVTVLTCSACGRRMVQTYGNDYSQRFPRIGDAHRRAADKVRRT